MKVHGRLHPGRLRDLAQPLELRLHQPREASGVTIKLWELDAFLGADGKPRREGSPDDLLATFTGRIEPAPRGSGRAPDWRAFKVESVQIAPAPSDALKVRLVFPGSDTVYELPVLSEAQEVEGTEYEFGFSLELGGAEVFRTKSPCLLAPATVIPRVRELVVSGFDDDGEPLTDDAYEVAPTIDALTIGRAPLSYDDDAPDTAVLDVPLEHPTTFSLAGAGLLRRTEPTDDATVVLAAGRRLRAFLGPPGAPPTAARSVAVEPDGTITIYRVDTSHRRTLFAGAAAAPGARRRGERDLPVAPSLITGRATLRRRALLGGGK